jgi:hypothetical protein
LYQTNVLPLAFLRRVAHLPASASVPASGFSHATCLPASSAAIDCSAWTSFGVPMSTRPISGLVTALLPIGRRVLPAPLLLELVQLCLVPADDRVHDRLHGTSPKNLPTFRNALLCVRPMNFCPTRHA